MSCSIKVVFFNLNLYLLSINFVLGLICLNFFVFYHLDRLYSNLLLPNFILNFCLNRKFKFIFSSFYLLSNLFFSQFLLLRYQFLHIRFGIWCRWFLFKARFNRFVFLRDLLFHLFQSNSLLVINFLLLFFKKSPIKVSFWGCLFIICFDKIFIFVQFSFLSPAQISSFLNWCSSFLLRFLKIIKRHHIKGVFLGLYNILGIIPFYISL